MPNALFIDIKQFTNASNKIRNLESVLIKRLDDVLNKNALDIETAAKQNASKVAFDEGRLAGSISADTSQMLRKKITVNVDYAAYVEFGTGAYGAAYVSTLPATWKKFAAQFKGKTGKKGLYPAILAWVKRKGLAATYSVKSKRRQRGGKAEEQRTKQVAYLIYRSILKHGTKPHPYLRPAFEAQRPIIIKDVENIFK